MNGPFGRTPPSCRRTAIGASGPTWAVAAPGIHSGRAGSPALEPAPFARRPSARRRYQDFLGAPGPLGWGFLGEDGPDDLGES